jgi:hypothetical protein
MRHVKGFVTLAAVCFMALACASGSANELRVGVFQIDASPRVGAPLAYDTCIEVTDPLSLRGIVIVGAGEPIVICAVDWIGIANEAHQALRRQLAAATKSNPHRVAVHALHQHDAPRCDFSSASLLAHHGVEHSFYDVRWSREVFDRAAVAVRQAVEDAKPFNEIGLGVAEVKEVASNRRLLDDDGKLFATRFTATRDPKLRDMPTGTIDPLLRSISLWHDDEPLVVLTYYATHPQSYYRTGKANPDFPGYARDARQGSTGIPHIHLNGAGGNIGAGKWNDGSPENRAILAGKVAAAMEQAFESTERQPIVADDISWDFVSVQLPVAEHLNDAELVAQLEQPAAAPADYLQAAKHLAWLRRSRQEDPVDISCLTLGTARVLHLPGELFVEYQLAAAAMRPDLFVAMAAYGDYGPGYIGTEIAYSQGGYETSPRASRVAPRVEQVLVDAIAGLLQVEGPLGPPIVPLGVQQQQ